MTKTSSVNGLQFAQNWVERQRALREQNPGHKVIVDIGIESVRGLHPSEIITSHFGAHTLDTLDALQGINMADVWRELCGQQLKPAGGAGGLGIIEESLSWSGKRYGEENNFGIVGISLLHTTRRRQLIDGTRQKIEFYNVQPSENEYRLIEPSSVIMFAGKETPITQHVFTGFGDENSQTLSLKISLPGVTDVLYPNCDSQGNFDQMHALGQGGFRLVQTLGLLGVENPAVDLVIGHDGHTALFKFNLFLYFLEKYKDKEAALAATRKLCRATIHAPQNGTVPRTSGEMVRVHYTEAEERIYGELGLDPGKKTNALFAEIALSKDTGGVSPIHLMVTEAEERARKKEGNPLAAKLLPENVTAKDLKHYPDTLDVESWLGLAVALVLDEYQSGWRKDPMALGKDRIIDTLSSSPDFKADLVNAFLVQDEQFLNLYNRHFPKVFEANVPENAIVLASLRRATAYKISLLMKMLEKHETIECYARSMKRPIHYIFGGLAHQDDTASVDMLERLLKLIEEINNKKGYFTANFLTDYNYDKARWLFPGLSIRGCWIGCTNPIDGRSQGTEAFGPSYLKAAMNGLYIIGPYDGGAGCLRLLPTVFNYGPTTFAGQKSFHSELWNNQALIEMSSFLLTNGFIGALEQVARRIDQDLKRYKSGRGINAPSLNDKIRSMLYTIAHYNGLVLMQEYLRGVE